jgi:hypothetical protein
VQRYRRLTVLAPAMVAAVVTTLLMVRLWLRHPASAPVFEFVYTGQVVNVTVHAPGMRVLVFQEFC